MSAVQIQERRVNTSGGTSAKATTVNGQFSQIIKKTCFIDYPFVVSNQASFYLRSFLFHP